MLIWLNYLESLGIFVGGYHYSLKMFTFEKVRARNFARAWGFVQFSQVSSSVKLFAEPYDMFSCVSGSSDRFRSPSCRLLEPEFHRTSRLLSLCRMLNHRQLDVVLGWPAQEKRYETQRWHNEVRWDERWSIIQMNYCKFPQEKWNTFVYTNVPKVIIWQWSGQWTSASRNGSFNPWHRNPPTHKRCPYERCEWIRETGADVHFRRRNRWHGSAW